MNISGSISEKLFISVIIWQLKN